MPLKGFVFLNVFTYPNIEDDEPINLLGVEYPEYIPKLEKEPRLVNLYKINYIQREADKNRHNKTIISTENEDLEVLQSLEEIFTLANKNEIYNFIGRDC